MRRPMSCCWNRNTLAIRDVKRRMQQVAVEEHRADVGALEEVRHVAC